jgi:alternate signal-mediated exported protein
MKFQFLKNKKLILTLAACAVLAVGLSSTYAILKAQTNTVNNTFGLEQINTHIDEPDFPGQEVKPGASIKKDVKIVNDGPSDAFIRARVTISPSNVGITTSYVEKDEAGNVTKTAELGDGWEYNKSDGWYYYKKVVPVDESTTALFTTVTLPDDLNQNFDLTVYQEAVGTGSYTVNSTDIKVEKIKDLFDNITTKQDGN